MQIKEFEGYTLKECLQQVRDALGPDAVILETRKFRKGGFLGIGSRDAVCVVAATGITVQNDLPDKKGVAQAAPARAEKTPVAAGASRSASPAQAAAVAAARNAYTRPTNGASRLEAPAARPANAPAPIATQAIVREAAAPPANAEAERLGYLERTMREIRDNLTALKQEQAQAHERTVTAVVSAVTPAVQAAHLTGLAEAPTRFPALQEKLLRAGVSNTLANDLLEQLPDFDAWSEEAREPMAQAALRDLMAQRISCAGGIELTPGQLKAIALIGPTGVGKTTTIAKLAAHFALVEKKRVALLTMDTYRIAAVEQLKTYSQIIEIPISVAYDQSEVLPAVSQYADYDLLLIDTAGRSQKNIMQVGELKAMLEMVRCETHLALSAPVKEQDLLEAVKRFSAARVDRILFSKLDETSSYGTLFNVVDQTGLPISYLTTGQRVPEDIQVADSGTLADLILSD